MASKASAGPAYIRELAKYICVPSRTASALPTPPAHLPTFHSTTASITTHHHHHHQRATRTAARQRRGRTRTRDKGSARPATKARSLGYAQNNNSRGRARVTCGLGGLITRWAA
ncbi:hypothetical protein FA95DRAFT_1555935 [Auriscalpium vulgare]|uniref:Uncharacterized protein n=1 Tax=Auriscalpium vulgare TaxID=40419 RepID=A0ACB8S268_9AGAM|nr:hypothetical protein FA95DRAFT_1555935 [Auriscalpium vulgare]